MVIRKNRGKLGYSSEEFKELANKTLGDLYSFNADEYKNRKSILTLKCPKHGEFSLKANSIFYGLKVLPCAGCREETWVSDFVKRSRLAHGDKYDYSQVTYPKQNQDYPVLVGCRKHGDFVTNAYSHTQGRSGCRKCHLDNNRSSGEYFVEKAREVHGEKYDYSKVIYIHGRKHVTIVCKEHGGFEQYPDVHLMGSGCKECFNERCRLTKDLFEERARVVHGDKYDYSQVDYKDSKIKVKIICQNHGVFEITPNAHVSCKQGCRRCKESKGESRIRNFLERHGIEFVQEYRIGSDKFRYDFFLPSYGILIEFQGQQHFKPIDIFGGQVAYAETCERDRLKFLLAKKKGYFLARPTFRSLKEDRLERYLLKLLRSKGHVFDPVKTIVQRKMSE